MIYIPKEIWTMICNYCGDTIEQKQIKLWKSIIPNREEQIFLLDIYPFRCGIARYWFTNLDFTIPNNLGVMADGKLVILLYKYLSNQ
tara:strand:+ start:791 stop:1051 length:261 start_codon:yes stop_codon:yes gene_type:complete